MGKLPRAYNVCSECGAGIYSTVRIRGTKALLEAATNAVCKTCDSKSNWRRTNAERC